MERPTKREVRELLEACDHPLWWERAPREALVARMRRVLQYVEDALPEDQWSQIVEYVQGDGDYGITTMSTLISLGGVEEAFARDGKMSHVVIERGGKRFQYWKRETMGPEPPFPGEK